MTGPTARRVRRSELGSIRGRRYGRILAGCMDTGIALATRPAFQTASRAGALAAMLLHVPPAQVCMTRDLSPVRARMGAATSFTRVEGIFPGRWLGPVLPGLGFPGLSGAAPRLGVPGQLGLGRDSAAVASFSE